MVDLLAVVKACSSPALASGFRIMKIALNIIHIVVPILLLISLGIAFFKGTISPDDKKSIPRIRNSIIATFVVFFLPTIVNVVMLRIDSSYTVGACWREVSGTNSLSGNYYDPYDGRKKKSRIGTQSGDYEKGDPTKGSNSSSSSNGNDGNNSNSNFTLGDSDNTPISGDLQVHFINPDSRVDAIYIKVGNEGIFVDGGYKRDGQTEIKYLQKIGVKKIDYYIASHSHKNHVEAAPAIIKKYGVKNVIVGRETCSSSGGSPCSWYAIKYFAKEQGVSLSGVNSSIMKPGDKMNVNGLKISCIGPMSVTNGLSRGDTKQNYNSLILRLDYGSTSFLLTGDNSSSSNWKASSKAYPGKLNVDVLKNAHHNGNNSSSSYALASPKYVVFLTDNNHLPSSSCISNIKKNGASNYYIVSGGKSGNVVFSTNGSSINVRTRYNP